MVPLLEVEFLYQVSPLATVEPSDDVESFVVESQGGVEVPPGVEIGDLGPHVCGHIVDLALVHAIRRQRRANSKDLGLLLLNEHTGQGVSPSLEDHVPSLDKPLFHELIAALGSFPWLSSTSEEDTALFIFY